MYLYDIRTSNNKTGTVTDSNSSLTTVQIGRSTTIVQVLQITFSYSFQKVDDPYNGATIKITTPVLNKVIGEDLETVQLEDNQTHGGNNGILILEQQGSKWCFKCS